MKTVAVDYVACVQTKRVSQAIDYTDFTAIHSLYMQGAKKVAREFCGKKIKTDTQL